MPAAFTVTNPDYGSLNERIGVARRERQGGLLGTSQSVTTNRLYCGLADRSQAD